jgi:hypothetical protein
VDKELVNFRRETTNLLKQHGGEEEQQILHSIQTIVGQCLGMGTPEFRVHVLQFVDEAEVLAYLIAVSTSSSSVLSLGRVFFVMCLRFMPPVTCRS